MVDCWDNYDIYQKHLTMVAYEIESIIECCKQYKGLINEIDNNGLDVINIAPSFFSEIINSFKYKIIVASRKIFDDSSSGNFKKLLTSIKLNKQYYAKIENICKPSLKELKTYDDILQIIRNDRNKYYGHLQMNFFAGIVSDAIFDEHNFNKLNQLLEWAWNVVCQIMQICNASIPSRFYNIDVNKLFCKLK